MSVELVRVGIKGRWRDERRYANGHVEVTPWTPNQIQNTAATLVASLLARTFEGAVYPDLTGLTYLAVGSGLSAWDTTPPTQDRADTTLTTEYFRKAIPVTDIQFMDPDLPAGSTPVAGPTRKITLSTTLLSGEANGSMREFGLFGGDADGVADSGLMLNWIVHSKIEKDSSLVIVRTVELEVQLPA